MWKIARAMVGSNRLFPKRKIRIITTKPFAFVNAGPRGSTAPKRSTDHPRLLSINIGNFARIGKHSDGRIKRLKSPLLTYSGTKSFGNWPPNKSYREGFQHLHRSHRQ
jgi:hypothetical protein